MNVLSNHLVILTLLGLLYGSHMAVHGMPHRVKRDRVRKCLTMVEMRGWPRTYREWTDTCAWLRPWEHWAPMLYEWRTAFLECVAHTLYTPNSPQTWAQSDGPTHRTGQQGGPVSQAMPVHTIISWLYVPEQLYNLLCAILWLFEINTHKLYIIVLKRETPKERFISKDLMISTKTWILVISLLYFRNQFVDFCYYHLYVS